MRSTAIIPARMASTRFPGKPLADIAGKPLIQWVYERTSLASSLSRVMVATCDREIADVVAGFGGEVVMTSDKHRSGTDRIAEAAAAVDCDIVVNVQGDEPLIDPGSIDRAVEPLVADQGIQMVSLMVPIDSEAARDPNLVKVVVDRQSFALYFSRSPIPYERNPAPVLGRDFKSYPSTWIPHSSTTYGHVGLYAYRKDFLLRFAALDPTPLEQMESLEQLRALEHGFRIKMVEVADRPLGVDTEEDLKRVRQIVLKTGD